MNFKVNDYDKFAEKRHFEVTNGMKKALRFIEKPMMLSMLPNIEGKRILLLGCGTAEESEMLSKYNPKKITGIDISEKSIAIAKESYPNCNFYVGNMLNLSFKKSRCIDECEEIDKAYYNRFHEIPQFMGFLVKKLKSKLLIKKLIWCKKDKSNMFTI